MAAPVFMPLSERQKVVLSVVVAFLREKHYPPTIQEIQVGATLGNPGLVFKVLTALEDKGYIVRTKSKHRSARLTALGDEFVNSGSQLSLRI